MRYIMKIKTYYNNAASNHGKAGKDIISSSDLVLGLFDQRDITTFRHTNQMTTNQNIQQIKDRFMDLR